MMKKGHVFFAAEVVEVEREVIFLLLSFVLRKGIVENVEREKDVIVM